MVLRISAWVCALIVVGFASTVAAGGGGRVPGEYARAELPAAVGELFRDNQPTAERARTALQSAFDSLGDHPSGSANVTQQLASRENNHPSTPQPTTLRLDKTTRSAISKLPKQRDVSPALLSLITSGVLEKERLIPDMIKRRPVVVPKTSETLNAEFDRALLGAKLHQILRVNAVVRETGVRVVRELDGPEQMRQFLLDAKVPEAFVSDVTEAFDHSALVRQVVFENDVELLRVFGDGSKPLSVWYFCCIEQNTGKSRSADASGLAFPLANSTSNLALVKIPKGTRALIGSVADRWGRPGRNVQVYLPDEVKDFAFTTLAPAPKGREPDDIVVEFDEQRSVRFRPPSAAQVAFQLQKDWGIMKSQALTKKTLTMPLTRENFQGTAAPSSVTGTPDVQLGSSSPRSDAHASSPSYEWIDWRWFPTHSGESPTNLGPARLQVPPRALTPPPANENR